MEEEGSVKTSAFLDDIYNKTKFVMTVTPHDNVSDVASFVGFIYESALSSHMPCEINALRSCCCSPTSFVALLPRSPRHNSRTSYSDAASP